MIRCMIVEQRANIRTSSFLQDEKERMRPCEKRGEAERENSPPSIAHAIMPFAIGREYCRRCSMGECLDTLVERISSGIVVPTDVAGWFKYHTNNTGRIPTAGVTFKISSRILKHDCPY